EFDLINNKRYRIYVLGDNFLTVKKDILVTGDTTFQVLTQSFEENKPIVFEALNFGSNSTKLKATVKPHLDYVVRFLKNYPMFKLEVEGHTDSDGRAESNLSLSQKRAESIATYIIEQGGFNPDRVTSRGYGETRPIVPNDTEENKEKNRRVEFKLTLDKSYEGDLWLPTSDELFIDEELDLIDDEFDPNEEFEWSEEERKSWEEELDVDPDLDLEAELEDDILRLLKDDDNEEVKKDPVKKGKDGGSRD
ncbi:MAG: OmpA family protein, partial [Bacteroidetes bacterium]|nr:OmpA family protein [Bacteroidota bacterium]